MLPDLPIPSDWPPQFYLLLSVSCVFALLEIRASIPRTRRVLLWLRYFLAIVAGYPCGPFVVVDAALLTPVLWDASYTEVDTTLAARLVRNVFYIAVAVFSQHSVRIWGVLVDGPGVGSRLDLAVYLCLVTGLGMLLRLLGDMLRGQQQRTAALDASIVQLTTANVSFQRYAHDLGRNTTLQERNRVSREIHDTIGHSLTTLMMTIEACHDLVAPNPAEARRMLKEASARTREALWETRRAVRALRTIGDFEQSGIRAVKLMAERFQDATGVEVRLDYGNVTWDHDLTHPEIVYSVVQEGLTNAFRHGQASAVRVMFWRDERLLRVSVLDNGRGSGEVLEGIGLLGMRERLSNVGGRLSFGGVGNGFQLSAWIPEE